MQPVSTSKKIGCFGYFLLVFNLIIIAHTYGQLRLRHRCVELQNGLLIGSSTVSSQLVGWDVDVALKLPDGRVIMRGGQHDIIFWDQNMLGGRILSPKIGNKAGFFIYDNKLGFISGDKHPKLYRQYQIDHKLAIKKSQVTAADMATVYFALKHKDFDILFPNQPLEFKREKYNIGYYRSWCPTAWFEPEMVDLESISVK